MKRPLFRRIFHFEHGPCRGRTAKFINYGAKLAVYGDYSGYTSKPLRDFIRESNRGRDIFFPATRQEAILRLAGV